MVCGYAERVRFNTLNATRTSLRLQELLSASLIPGPHLILPSSRTSMASQHVVPRKTSRYIYFGMVLVA